MSITEYETFRKVDLYTFIDVPVHGGDLTAALRSVIADRLPFTMQSLSPGFITNLWELPSSFIFKEWMQIVVGTDGTTQVIEYTPNRSIATSVKQLGPGGRALISGFNQEGEEKLAYAVYHRLGEHDVLLPPQFPGTKIKVSRRSTPRGQIHPGLQPNWLGE